MTFTASRRSHAPLSLLLIVLACAPASAQDALELARKAMRAGDYSTAIKAANPLKENRGSSTNICNCFAWLWRINPTTARPWLEMPMKK